MMMISDDNYKITVSENRWQLVYSYTFIGNNYLNI